MNLASCPRIGKDVVSRDLDGEVVILNLRTGIYFGLDPVGTRIWQLIVKRRSLREVLDSLLDEYEVPARRCAADLLEFVARLEGHALVEIGR